MQDECLLRHEDARRFARIGVYGDECAGGLVRNASSFSARLMRIRVDGMDHSMLMLVVFMVAVSFWVVAGLLPMTRPQLTVNGPKQKRAGMSQPLLSVTA